MSRETMSISPELREYMLSVSLRETDVLRRLRLETGRMSNSNMQISPEQGQLLHFLVGLTGAERALEVGVFTGYSALWTALALPPGGILTACDVNSEWTETAAKYWAMAGVEGRIELKLAPAEKTLMRLLDRGEAGSMDFAFIDADKESYPVYYELCLELLGNGGLMAIDNVFRHGRVIDTGADDPGTAAIRELNRRIAVDDRVDVSMLPVGDGLTLVRKR
ncbi:MAG: class I SAM-dependent methyltransferase [Candidatus Aegiribacteria sp.]